MGWGSRWGHASAMMHGTRSGWRTCEGGSVRSPCRVFRVPVTAGRRPWPRIDFWTTRPLARRRCSPNIYRPRWSGVGRRLWSCSCKTRHVQKAHAAGRLTVELTRQPDRPPRPVSLRGAVRRVSVNGARRPGGQRPPVEVVAVYAKEYRPPSGEEPIAWLLLTSVPVADFPSACTVVQWHRCRWEIELFFRMLKPGCQIEP
jgi:hypothetical protein